MISTINTNAAKTESDVKWHAKLHLFNRSTKVYAFFTHDNELDKWKFFYIWKLTHAFQRELINTSNIYNYLQ